MSFNVGPAPMSLTSLPAMAASTYALPIATYPVSISACTAAMSAFTATIFACSFASTVALPATCEAPFASDEPIPLAVVMTLSNRPILFFSFFCCVCDSYSASRRKILLRLKMANAIRPALTESNPPIIKPPWDCCRTDLIRANCP